MSTYKSRIKDFAAKQKKLDALAPLEFIGERNIQSLGDVIYELWFAGRNTDTNRFHKKYQRFVKQYTGSLRTREVCYISAKQYIPDITCEQVYKAVESLYTTDFTGGLSYSFCYTVQRLVSDRIKSMSKEAVNQYLDTLKLNVRL